ncbi:helix-turn-helix domain-containing protein [Litorivicinus lipolyticus]|uniref:Helix-turn-helix domain-containing protein n=1 Tax=Litorivicinus lipolyticus TaxID=418701 RepID=A0A5Q2QC90_9GAMM|nr:AraC family transcriptional regulator [Litorivicinus lipolyticus]QGG79902.1 helix-turn-helix domain-containing protein [Litorivicinus lipolyticus]
MNARAPQLEVVDPSQGGVRYLEHGWPHDLIRWHAHDEYELHLLVATRGKVFVGDYVGQFKPGQLILTGPRVPHNWLSESAQAVELRDMAIQFRPELYAHVASVMPEIKALEATLNRAQSGVEFVGFDLLEAQQLMAAVRDSQGLQRIAAFFELMARLANWPNQQSLSTLQFRSSLTGAVESKISEVVRHVVDNHRQQIRLADMAELAGMSVSSFSRHFQKGTGNRFVEFVTRVRVSRACSLLAETNDQVSSIGFAVGFNNLANFNRHFTKLKGQSPGEFRRAIRQTIGAEPAPVED